MGTNKYLLRTPAPAAPVAFRPPLALKVFRKDRVENSSSESGSGYIGSEPDHDPRPIYEIATPGRKVSASDQATR